MISHNDFLALAERLIEDAPSGDSAEIRSSISRAYYYVFHYGRERFSSHPRASFVHGAEDHRELVEFLERIGETRLSGQIRKFRQKRNEADYDFQKDLKKVTVKGGSKRQGVILKHFLESLPAKI